MAFYSYKAFGLIVESEIEIPEFVPAYGKTDVFIRLGEVSAQLDNSIFSGVRFQAAPNRFLLNVDHIARYFAEDGHKVTIQPLENSSEQDIRIFLLGSVFGALMHMRGLFPLHGSSIVYNNRVIVFSGVSGVGKSTLAAAMQKHGFQVFNDDMSVVMLDSNSKPLVYPGYPEMKLWVDSVEKMGLDPNLQQRARFMLDKCRIPFFLFPPDQPLPLESVYMLQSKNCEGIEIESLKGLEKFNSLKNNTYRLNFIRGLGNTTSHFQHISAVAKHCTIKRIIRSSKGFHLDQLVDLILEDLKLQYGDQ